MSDVHVKVAGTGSYLPGVPVPFDDIEKYIGTIEGAPSKVQKWIDRIKPLMKEMLDIEYYHYAINVTMSVKASLEALKSADMKADRIDLIIYASAHMDQMPTASVRIQESLGIEKCAELSIHANCTSAYKAIMLAHDLIRIGRYDNVLVVSSSVSSSELRAGYYNMDVVKKENLFLRWFLCDGAGAVIFKRDAQKSKGLYLENSYIESIGGKKPSVMGNMRPAYWMNPKEEYEAGYHHLSQMFQEQLREYFHDPDGTVFFKGLKRMIEKYGIDLSHLRFFQVNLPSKHISELVVEECAALGIKKETLYTKMSKMGYSGPPMAYICLDRIFKEESLKKNDMILSFVTEVSKFMQAGYSMVYY
jgi:3-oxoacyl-[acyl-carrier-protein] synthase-3